MLFEWYNKNIAALQAVFKNVLRFCYFLVFGKGENTWNRMKKRKKISMKPTKK